MDIRVLHVVRSREPEAGAIAVSLAGLFPALHARGVASSVVTPDHCWSSWDADTASSAAREGVAELIERASVVHIHGWGEDHPVDLAAAARRQGKPYIISPLGGLAAGSQARTGFGAKLRAMFKTDKLVRSASMVTGASTAEHEELTSRRVHATATYLPYGMDTADYAHPLPDAPSPDSTGVPAEGAFLLLMAPIHPHEGHVVLLKALAELGRSCGQWGVILAGRRVADWQEMLEAAVRRKGAVDRVCFVDAPDIASQRALLNRCSVVVSPGLRVGGSVALLQAAASGVPVLASNRVMPSELSGAVHTAEPTQAAMRESLRSVLSMSEDDRTARAHEARERMRATLDWSVLADRYVELYQRVV